MNILGLSAFYHDSAACLLRDGTLVAAAQEERFTRVKHDRSFPARAASFCLASSGASIADIDCVAWYELPERRLSRQLWVRGRAGQSAAGGARKLAGQSAAGGARKLGGDGEGERTLGWVDPLRAEREIREVLGFEGPIVCVPHHAAHAASSFLFSGFDEAAVMTVDAVGEWATTTYGRGVGTSLEVVEQVELPHSMGLFYSAITRYLGFRINDGEYKVMGLAPYGRPRFVEQLRQVLVSRQGGQFFLDTAYVDLASRSAFSARLAELLGEAPRAGDAPLSSFHEDVARSAQELLEEVLLEKVTWLASQVSSANLCLAGGVALNCVANGRILREGPFERLFVPPAPGDAGGAMGAAALAWVERTGQRLSGIPLVHAYYGPRFSESVGRELGALGIAALDLRGCEASLLDETVERLAAGRIVAWFQGRMEFGPRALGARSILADPRDPEMRDRVNHLVKKRESFRPFTPAVLLSEAQKHFELDHPSPFMLETCRVRSPLALPAITHVDGSARPQTVDPRHQPRFAALLERFFATTGCPMLLNTSLNVKDEPIACTPVDALRTMVAANIDTLVIEDFVVDRAHIPERLAALLLEERVYDGRTEPRAEVYEAI